MRLHHLEITAFGPYSGTESIDMVALTASGLFLLEGPTGAGKSAILDAVTFALYGHTSGDGGHDRLHSDFADPAVEPKVVLDLSVGGERLRITRTPAYDRPKKVGKGTTPQATTVHLERLEDGSWTSVSSNKAEVGSIIRARLGLSAEQFTQVVLLPQGEFQKFLRAKDDDRRELLTTIFGTHLYDRITSTLDAMSREAGRDRDRADREVAGVLSAAAQAAGLEGDERTRLLALPDAERPAALDVITRALRGDAAAADEQLASRTGALVEAQRAWGAADKSATLHADYATALELQRRHEAGRREHERLVEELRLATSAALVGVLLGQLEDADETVERARGALRVAAPDLDPTTSDGGGADEHERLARCADAAAAELGPLVARETALVSARGEIASLTAELAALRDDLTTLDDEARGLPDRVAAAEAAIATTAAVAAGASAAAEAESVARGRLAAATDLEALQPALARALADLQTATARRLLLAEDHLALWARRLDGIASTLADELVDGAPCRVCGSTGHPDPAQPAPDAVSAADVELARSRASLAETDEQLLAEQFHALDRRRAELVGRAGDSDLATLRVAATSAAAAVGAARVAAGEVPGLRARLEALTTRQRQLAAEIAIARGSEATLQEKTAGLSSRVASEDRAVAAARGEHPTVAEHRSALQECAARHRAASAALAELRRSLRSRLDLLGLAEEESRAQGFADVAGARAARRSPARVEELRTVIAAWSARATTCAGAVHDARFAGLDPADSGLARQRLIDAGAALVATEGAHRDAVSGAATATKQLADLEECRKELERVEEDRARVHDDTAPIIRLAGLAKGTNSGLKMSLTTYVLRRWFEQVVQAANHRLGAMSSGRYELERVDEADTCRQRAGLTLKVIDRHTGMSRDPSSLSGGETFYTSLALALGLADVVRAEAGGVELDTLFIDEGFGTLDSETLDQVMSVIDELRDGGRVVGIVSHVADLKEQVAERLEVRRRPDGSSFTTVVA